MIKRVLCFSNPAYLSLRDGQLVLRLPEVEKNDSLSENFKKEAVATIPVEDIGVVVLDNPRITITQALMCALVDNNAAIINCNEQHMPVSLEMPLCCHTLQSERFQKQINASEPLKKQMWQQTVTAKIQGQAFVLDSERVECRNMRRWAQDVRSGDADNLEGRAAAYYWKTLFVDIPDFKRGQDEAPPNNLLNYGYAILRAMMARELVATGLLPTLGIHHHNRYNAYCLADDIMEPYRPAVDLLVLEIIHRYRDYEELNLTLKKELLGLPVRDVIMDGKRTPLMTAVQLTAQSVSKCFIGESRKIIYPDW